MQQLQLLADACPPWVNVFALDHAGLRFDARLVRGSGDETRTYLLGASVENGRVVVREDATDRLLPTDCPQRHINGDASFYVGLRAGAIHDNASAVEWWNQLSVFILGQETAHSEGIWPSALQLSHGNEAADLELREEELAKKLSLVDELHDAIRFDVGPIAEHADNVSVITGRPRGRNAPCVCGYVNANGRLKKRKECYKDGSKCLVNLEARRRAEERAFWKSQANKMCCGTMRECPRRRPSLT